MELFPKLPGLYHGNVPRIFHEHNIFGRWEGLSHLVDGQNRYVRLIFRQLSMKAGCWDNPLTLRNLAVSNLHSKHSPIATSKISQCLPQLQITNSNNFFACDHKFQTPPHLTAKAHPFLTVCGRSNEKNFPSLETRKKTFAPTLLHIKSLLPGPTSETTRWNLRLTRRPQSSNYTKYTKMRSQLALHKTFLPQQPPPTRQELEHFKLQKQQNYAFCLSRIAFLTEDSLYQTSKSKSYSPHPGNNLCFWIEIWGVNLYTIVY